jgi:lipopolysaccharide biosynthesis glycosyltransferase
MELVSDNKSPTPNIEREKGFLDNATARFAANMLRIMAGAGEPRELVEQLVELVKAAEALQKVKGDCSTVMATALYDWRKQHDEAYERLIMMDDPKRYKNARQIQGETRVVHFALRVAAAKLLHSTAQASIAESKMLEAAREWDKDMLWHTP